MADLAMDIWIKAHDEASHVFKKMAGEAEGLRGKIALLAGGFGVLAGGVLAQGVKQAAEFLVKTPALANNTRMGAAGLAAMPQAVLKPSAAAAHRYVRSADR